MKIAVVSVGSGAAKLLASIAALGLDLRLVAVDSDRQTLKRACAQTQVLLGAATLRGLGASGDPEAARAAAEGEVGELRELLGGEDLVVVVVGLGGGTGTGAAPVVCRAARSAGARVTAVAGWPLPFEGKRRRRQAEEGLEALRRAANEVVVAEAPTGDAEDAGPTLLEAFALLDARIASAVRAALAG